MTSKLIEALNKCETQKSYENVRYTLIDDELRAYIEESLKRLEELEKENQMLKDKGALSLTVEWLGMRVKQLEKELKMYRYIIKNGKASRGRYKLLIDWNNNYTAYEFIKEVLEDE